VLGAAALAFGLITLAWHDYNGWHLPRYIVYPAAAAEIFGGAAIQFRRTAKTGAVALGMVYLVFALRCVPQIFAEPQIYNSWGNFFEQFSLVTGAAIVYVRLSSPWSRETLNRIGRIFWGICAASFTLEQAVYLGPTANLVPKWLPPTQMFWAVTTTVPGAKPPRPSPLPEQRGFSLISSASIGLMTIARDDGFPSTFHPGCRDDSQWV
jgi:hypothetical protein